MIKYFKRKESFRFRASLYLFAILSFSIDTIAQSIVGNDSAIFLADPAIFNDQGNYYLYGTVGGNANNGFLVYTSGDLKSWKLCQANNGYALKKGDAFGNANFWAPQVFRNNDQFY